MLIISETTLEINERFFEALDSLKQKRLLGGVGGFSKKYGVSFGNLYTIKTQRQGAVKAEFLSCLTRDFNISAEWLLTGEGEMFKQTSSRNEESPIQETFSSERNF